MKNTVKRSKFSNKKLAESMRMRKTDKSFNPYHDALSRGLITPSKNHLKTTRLSK